MSDKSQVVEKTVAALKKYIEIGQKTADALKSEDFDQALVLLKERQKVFSNFRAMEYILNVDGTDIRTDRRFIEMGVAISRLNQELEDMIAKASTDIQESFARMQKAQRGISQYKSGTPHRSKFIKGA